MVPKIILLTAIITTAIQLLSSATAEQPSLPYNRGLFAADLLKHITHEKSSENVVFSPVSIQTALAMVHQGAEGETAKELENSLRLISSDKEAVGQGFLDLINRRSGQTQLSIANRIFYNSKYELNTDFNARTKQYFNSEAEPIDVNQSLKAVDTINSWVAEETGDNIKEIISPSSVDHTLSAIIVNAIYFKGRWQKPFDKDETEKSPFWVTKDTSVEVDTMSVGGVFKYGDFPELDATALELAYKYSNISMILILPNQIDDLANLESKLSSVAINELALKMENKRIDVKLPKFKMEFTIQLPEILKKMGMRSLFENPNLSGIFKSSGVSFSDVTHKAFIKVDEVGSEAGAATSIAMSRMGRIYNKEEFKVDHPFVFAIKDAEAVYFVGHVSKF